jgi:hypothetical protein
MAVTALRRPQINQPTGIAAPINPVNASTARTTNELWQKFEAMGLKLHEGKYWARTD